MSSSPQKEHFQGCLKLYAENVSTQDDKFILIQLKSIHLLICEHSVLALLSNSISQTQCAPCIYG